MAATDDGTLTYTPSPDGTPERTNAAVSGFVRELEDLHNLAITAEALAQMVDHHGRDAVATDNRLAIDQARDNAASIVVSLDRALDVGHEPANTA